MNAAINQIQSALDEQKAIAQIQALVKELAKCAPHPDKPDHHGPLFLHNDPYFKLPDEHDSMLGGMVMESLLGTAFSAAAGEATASVIGSLWNGAEYADTYFCDRQKPSYRLGQRNMIANDFNGCVTKSPEYQQMMHAYLADLPHRLNLEKWIAHELRRIYSFKKMARMSVPALAA